MFCKHCGKRLDDNAAVCPHCDVPTGVQGKIPHPSDRPEFGYAAIGFFIPLVGLILYLVWRAEYPLRARSCGKGALSAVIFWLCLAVGTILIAAILLPMCYAAAPLFLRSR